MSIIKGQNLRVLIGGKCIAMSTSATFHVAAQVQDSSTKDDTGDWAENEIVGLSWDASTDSLVTLTDNGSNGEIPTELFAAMIGKTKLSLTFDVTSGTNNRTAENSALKKSGYAYIQDITVTAANRQNSTLTVSFVGTGALS